MIVGKDVASIMHPGYPSNIGHKLYCSWRNFSARYEEKVNKYLSLNPVPSQVVFQGILGESSRNALKVQNFATKLINIAYHKTLY
jgi:hypothetical protein